MNWLLSKILDGIIYLIWLVMLLFIKISDKILQQVCRHTYNKYDTNTCIKCGKEG